MIGGREDKKEERAILREVARRAEGGALVVCSTATQLPWLVGPDYVRLFERLGVDDVRLLDVRSSADADASWARRTLEGASVLFLTGGDQRRISGAFLGSALHRPVLDLYRRGGTVAGTSAGAMAMAATMLVGGPGAASEPGAPAMELGPGLGLIADAIVDSHFFQRGRFGRLLGAVATSPGDLGIGIDEDTALVLGPDGVGRVLGSGGVYVVDGTDAASSGAEQGSPLGVRSVYGARTHMLAAGDSFELRSRRARLDEQRGARRPILAGEGVAAD